MLWTACSRNNNTVSQMQKLPQEFIKRMQQQLGNEAEDFFASLSAPPPTSIRLNHVKGQTSFTNLENIPWCEEGYYLSSRPFFQMDPHWHGGAYYVQEASSMILDYVVSQINDIKHPKIWLDTCAAPGGKTGILAKHLGPCDVLVANEVVPSRRAILRENLYKAGYLNTFITSEQATSFHTPFADIILVDAPCSGEGMMRKEPESIRQWSPGLVRECTLMQQRIVDNVIRALLPGGYLIYSTCSYSADENMDNVSRFANNFPLKTVLIDFPEEWNITKIETGSAVGYQLFPHKVKGEGLFISVMQNISNEEKQTTKNKKQHSVFSKIPAWLSPHLNDPEHLMMIKGSESGSVVTNAAEEKANEIMRLFPRSELIAETAQMKGKDFIPFHFMSMAGLPAADTPIIELGLELSLDYLERNTVLLPADQQNHWYLFSYQNTILGWGKHTLKGWKNHYPLNWRLRSRKT